MILGLGIDLCDIARIERAIKNERFLSRVYTERERAKIAERGFSTAAGYFAAKEAASKALGTGFRNFMLKDIEIIPDALGRPEAILYNGALERMRALGGHRMMVSITHSGGYAAAVFIIEQ
jgi:holo-[acyl-carrier protein] synthase